MSIKTQGGKLISGNGLTMNKVFEEKDISSVGVMCKNGKEEIIAGLYISALHECWGLCENNFTKESVTDTAMMLIAEYPELRPQEIILILKNGLSGKYGTTYGKVTAQEVMRWALEYFEERMKYCENNALKPSVSLRDITPHLSDENKKLVEEKINPKLVIPEKNDNDKMMQGWIAQFDELCRKQKITEAGRFVDIDGVKMNIEDYLKYKLEANDNSVNKGE